MKTETKFLPIDRYAFDFKHCTTGKGFAQIDTGQDAHYFGTWANPFTLKIVNYAEGDVTEQQAETEAEFIEAIHEIKAWNTENGHEFFGIDPGLNDNLAEQFKILGLGDLFS